jgi:hypothetical protein
MRWQDIAHGYLTLSLIPWLTGGMLRVDGVTRHQLQFQ